MEVQLSPQLTCCHEPDRHAGMLDLMTIAKRFIILLVVPLLAFIGLGIFNWIQVTNVEQRSKFVSEMQIPSLATLGNITRSFAELRVDLRNHLLVTNEADRAAAGLAFDRDAAAVTQLLAQYGDTMISDNKDRRMLDDCRDSFHN